MSEDFAKSIVGSKEAIERKTLQNINSMLQSMGKDIKDFKLCSNDFISSANESVCKEVEEETNIVVSEADYQKIAMLTSEQQVAFKVITCRIFANKHGCFLIDGP